LLAGESVPQEDGGHQRDDEVQWVLGTQHQDDPLS